MRKIFSYEGVNSIRQVVFATIMLLNGIDYIIKEFYNLHIIQLKCISLFLREFGSGGRTIGKMVAQELGIPCYDSELLEKIAKESGFDERYIQEAGEYAPGGFLSSAFSHHPSGPNNADYLWNIQFRIITQLAEKGPCVIVGRCADYILRDKADCLRVFIHADMDFRAERIVKVYGESQQSPQQRLKDKDKRRAAYHRSYTDMK